MMREGLFEHHRLENLALLVPGGQTTAQAVLGPVPEGYAWYLEQAAFTVIGNSHTAAIDLAVTPDGGTLPAQATWDHQGLVWTTAAAVRGSMQPGVAIYMGPSHFLHVYLSGGSLAAGDAATFTAQIAVHSLDVHYMMSPEDTKQVKEAHERMSAELNMDAVGQVAV